jgi:hypothetical protein
MRLTIRGIMVGVLVVAANLAVMRIMFAFGEFAGYFGVLPLIVADLGAIQCSRTRGRNRAFGAGVIAVDALLSAHQADWMFHGALPHTVWWRYGALVQGALESLHVQLGGLPILALVAISATGYFLPIGLLAWLAGLAARGVFDLWIRAHAPAANSPAPGGPPS